MVPVRDVHAARRPVLPVRDAWRSSVGACGWLIAAVLGVAVFAACTSSSHAKTPGGTHCYGKTCHRVSTLEEMNGMVGRHGFLKASFYDDCRVDRFNSCALTSSGEVFRPDLADNAASPIFPDGTVILAYHPISRKAAVLRVNSAGPYWGDRRLDVSRATAEKLGFRSKGVAELMVTVVKPPEPEEARYRKMRRYAPVPGYIGTFASFEDAHTAALGKLALFVSPAAGAQLARGPAATAGMRQYAAIEPERGLAGLQEPEDEGTPARRDFSGVKQVPIEPAAPVTIIEVRPVLLESARPALADAPVSPGGQQAIDSAAVPGAMPAAGASPSATMPATPHEAAISVAGETAVAAARDPGPVMTIATRDDDDPWAELRARWRRFVAGAETAARARAPGPALPSLEELRVRALHVAVLARAKAQASAPRQGPLYKLVAELKLKAQPPRYDRD